MISRSPATSFCLPHSAHSAPLNNQPLKVENMDVSSLHKLVEHEYMNTPPPNYRAGYATGIKFSGCFASPVKNIAKFTSFLVPESIPHAIPHAIPQAIPQCHSAMPFRLLHSPSRFGINSISEQGHRT
jgi:hypothetical protein